MILQNFVVLEGCDGAGTTTQRKILRARLEQTALAGKVHDTCEPTDGPVGALVRAALAASPALTPATLARLFAADREEHLHGAGGVVERCARGEIVVSDRYVLSSYVYQGLLCGDRFVRRLNEDFPAPELLVFFDIDPETAFRRVEARGETKEIYEHLDFQRKLRARYKQFLPLCRRQGALVETIDAAAPIEEVSAALWRAVCTMGVFSGGASRSGD
jgi:dTMP kinase